MIGRAAIARRHGDDRDLVSPGGKLRERASGEDLDVIGMRMDCQDICFHEVCRLALGEFCTAALRSSPGAKRATRRAAISMVPPRRGSRTTRALCCEVANVPKPTSVTRSPRTRLVCTPSRNALSARAASRFVRRASLAILRLKSRLFTASPYSGRERYIKGCTMVSIVISEKV